MLAIFGSFFLIFLSTFLPFPMAMGQRFFIDSNYVVIYDLVSSASNRISPPISLQNLVFGNLGFNSSRSNGKIPHSPTPSPPYDTLVPFSRPAAELNAV